MYEVWVIYSALAMDLEAIALILPVNWTYYEAFNWRLKQGGVTHSYPPSPGNQ